MSYSVRQVASQLGVSKTAILQFIKRNNKKFAKNKLRKVGNKFMIPQSGFNIIKHYYQDKRKDTNKVSENKFITYLEEANKRQYNTIKKLQSNLQTQQKLTSQQQQLQLSSQEEIKKLKSNIKAINVPSKHGFIWRLFH